MNEFNKRSEDFENVNRDNPTPTGNDKGGSQFQVDRDNFSPSEFNEKRKKKISTGIKVVSTVISVSLLAGGGYLIGSSAFNRINATLNNFDLDIKSREVSYKVDITTDGPVSIILKNDFTNRVFLLNDAFSEGTFENLRPSTNYEVLISTDDTFKTILKKEKITTTAENDNDLYLFVEPTTHLKSSLEIVSYFSEEYQNEMYLNIVPDIGDPIKISSLISGENRRINLGDYNLLSSSGRVELYHKDFNGRDTLLLSKTLQFSTKITKFNDILIEKINVNELTLTLKIDYLDKNNVWKEFILLLNNEEIRIDKNRAKQYILSFNNPGDDILNFEVYIEPNDEKFSSTLYKVTQKTINLKEVNTNEKVI